MHLSKKTSGEHFDNLNLLSSLLNNKKKDDKKKKKNLVEVISEGESSTILKT